MGRPFERRRMEGIRIASWYMPGLENYFARSNVIAGIAVPQQALPRIEREDKQQRYEDDVADRRQREPRQSGSLRRKRWTFVGHGEIQRTLPRA